MTYYNFNFQNFKIYESTRYKLKAYKHKIQNNI